MYIDSHQYIIKIVLGRKVVFLLIVLAFICIKHS